MRNSLLRISPSRMRILNMDNELLLKNYALIMHRASSLSAMQRQLVKDRVSYLLKKDAIKMEQVTKAVNDLSDMIQEQILKEMKKADDSSTD